MFLNLPMVARLSARAWKEPGKLIILSQTNVNFSSVLSAGTMNLNSDGDPAMAADGARQAAGRL